jgi:hypothetical protein
MNGNPAKDGGLRTEVMKEEEYEIDRSFSEFFTSVLTLPSSVLTYVAIDFSEIFNLPSSFFNYNEATIVPYGALLVCLS